MKEEEEEEEIEELIKKLKMLQGMGGGTAGGGSVAGSMDFEEIQKMVEKMREQIEDQTPYSVYLKNQGKMPAMFQGMTEEEFRDMMEFQRMQMEMAKDQVKDVGWIQGEKDTLYLPSDARIVIKKDDAELQLTGWQKIGDTDIQIQETQGFGKPDETPAKVLITKSPDISVKDKKRVLKLIDRAENLLLQDKYERAAILLKNALRKSGNPTIEKILTQALKELAYKEYEKWAEKADMLVEKGKHERAIRLIMRKLEKVEDERLEELLRGEINRLELLKIEDQIEMADDHVYLEKYRSHEDREIDKIQILQRAIENTLDPEVKRALAKSIGDIMTGRVLGEDATMADYWNAHPEKHREYVEMLEMAVKNSRDPQRKAELRRYLNKLKSQK
jgi:tetratricopeptide (TPR) repeat protein